MRRFLMGCLLLACASWGWAEPACRLGKVLRVVGTVTVQRGAQNLVPVSGFGICRGDRVLTDAASIAELRLRDGSLLTVGKDTDFVIREFRLYKKQPNVALFELAKGAFRNITGLVTQRRHRYEVRTPVATIGVRGTDFWGGFGLSGDGLDVVMLEGRGVYVRNDAGTVELERPGMGTTVLAGAPEPATLWDEAKLKRAFATVTP